MRIRFIHSYRLLVLALFATLISCGNSKQIEAQKQTADNERAFKTAFHQANSEKMIGHTENAIDLFNRCITLDPEAAVAYFALSELYADQNEMEKAIDYGKKAYELNPKNKWYAFYLAESYFKIGDYFNSVTYYEKVVKDFGDRNLDTRSKLTQSYIFSNQKLKAVEVLNGIEVEDGKSVKTSVTKHDLLKELGKEDLAVLEIKTLFEAYQNSEEVPTEVMDYFLQTRQLEMAAMAITQIQKVNPENGNALIGLAEIELANHNIEQTFAYLEKGIKSPEINSDRKLMLLESLATLGFEIRFQDADKINKKMSGLFLSTYEAEATNERFLTLYGQYLMSNQKIDSALLMFNQAIEIDPSNFETWMNLLDGNYFSKQYDELIKDGRRALDLFPSQPLVYLLLGVGYYETGQFDDAEEAFFLGKELVVNDEELKQEFNYQSAKNLWKQGDEAGAKLSFETLFKQAPNNHKYIFGYASLLKASGSYDLARAQAKRAVELAHRNPEYLYLYGSLLKVNKEYQLAHEMISNAVNYDITNATYIELLGDLTFLLGDHVKSVALWEEAYRLRPNEILKLKIDTKSYNE